MRDLVRIAIGAEHVGEHDVAARHPIPATTDPALDRACLPG